MNIPRLLLSTSALLEFLFLTLFLFIFMFCFSAAGVSLFGGVIERDSAATANSTTTNSSTTNVTAADTTALDQSEYAMDEYWPLNFNDMLSGLVTAFILLLVNNMHIIEAGFDSALTSQTQAFFCKLFFLSFYALAVLFLLNIVTSFIVNQVDSVLKQDERFSIPISRQRTIEEIKQDHQCNVYPLPTYQQHQDGSTRDGPNSNNTDDAEEGEGEEDDHMDTKQETKNDHIQAAMAFVHYAKQGVFKSPEDVAIITATKYSLNSFIKRVRMEFFLQFASYALLFIGIFHRQLWTYRTTMSPNLSSEWSLSSVYINSRVRVLNPIVSGVIVTCLEVLLIYGILLEIGYKIDWREKVVQDRTWRIFVMEFLGLSHGHKSSHSRFSLRLMYVVVVAINLVILLGGFLSLAADCSITSQEGICATDPTYHTLSVGAVFSCWVSIISIFLFDRQAASVMKLIINISPRFVTLLVFLLVYVALFGYVGYSFFFPGQSNESTSNGASNEGPLDNGQYFGSLYDSMWTVFVVLTSSSVPSQLIPSYTTSRLAILYFMWFIIPGTFVLFNIIFAFVIVEYAKANKAYSDRIMRSRISCLHNAYDCINEDHDEEGLQYSQVYSLLRVYFDTINGYNVTKITDTKIIIMVTSLDVDNQGVIDFNKFACLLTIIQSHIILETRKYTYLPEFLTYSAAFVTLKKYVESGNFTFFIDTLVVILIIIGLVVNDSVYFFSHTEEIVIFVSATLSSIGLIVKLTCLGIKRYLKKSSHIFEMLLTISYLVLSAGLLFGYDFLHGTLKVIMMIKMIHFCRHVRYFIEANTWANITHEVKVILVSLKYILIVFFLVMYTFTLLGVARYGGRISFDPQNEYFNALMASSYAENMFFPLNFNDMLSGLYTLFCCLHVSDFDVIAAGMVSVSSKASGRTYFAVWNIVGDQLLLSIVRSVLLNSILNRKWRQSESAVASISPASTPYAADEHATPPQEVSFGGQPNSIKEDGKFLSKDVDVMSVYREFHVSVNILRHIIDNHAPELSKLLTNNASSSFTMKNIYRYFYYFNEGSGDHNNYKTYLTTVPLVDPIGDWSTSLTSTEKMRIIERLHSMSVDDLDSMTSSGPQLSFDPT